MKEKQLYNHLLKKDLELCPDTEDVKKYMKKAGFKDIKEKKIVEKNQTSPVRRLEQVKEKAFSGLKILSEEYSI